jgi:DNA-binding PadR family transcriptional regulator
MSLTVTKEMGERIIKNFMDLIILKELRTYENISGYDIILMFHKKFRMLLSAGSAYSVLYALERKNLIEGAMTEGKRTYKLTKKGEETIEKILRNRNQINHLIKSILGE